MGAGFVVWFTGLSGSGKSTLAAMLSAELRARGVHVEVLDGDEVRTHLSKGLGFSREDRDTNVRRIGFVAKLLARSGACAMTAAISPYKAIRDEQRAQIDHFVEVYCVCPVPALAERDPKGLYKKALAGEIKHFTGVDDPYEPPDDPEITVHTDRETKEESLARILARLEDLELVPRRAGERAGRAASTLIAPHGGELVNRYADGEHREKLVKEAQHLVALDLDERAEVDLDLIASGAFSPLKGFMIEKDYLRVVREMRLENGLPWPLPITLSVPGDKVDPIRIGAHVALRARDGRLVGRMDVADVWTPGETYAGGEVHVFDRPAPQPHRDPRRTRALLAGRGPTSLAGNGAFAGAPRGAGAREALLHALVHKNHGYAGFIVEPASASAEVRAIFAAFAPGEIGVEPLFWGR
jgi:adenylyl-sulfate kinase